jgi:hypothetical protein
MHERLTQTEPNQCPQPDQQPRPAIEREAGGKFKKGVGGRPPGSGTSLGFWQQGVQTLLYKSSKRLTRVCIQKALAGDVVCLRLCMERLLPPLRAEAAEFEARLQSLESKQCGESLH